MNSFANKKNDKITLMLDNEHKNKINNPEKEKDENKEKENLQNFQSTDSLTSLSTNNCTNEIQSSDEVLNFDTFFMIRCVLVAIAITLLSLNAIFGFLMPHYNINSIEDKAHIAFGGINEYFLSHNVARHALIITSSIFVDFISIATMVHWICYGKSWRLLVSLVLFYGFRSLVQVFF